MIRHSKPFLRFGHRSIAIVGTVAVLAAAIAISFSPAASQDKVGGEEALQPEHHFSIDRPGTLSKEDATVIYDTIADDMARRYGISGENGARNYRKWRRYNDAPFLSAAHGSRFVNIYANPVAAKAGYGDMKPGTKMPAGAIIAKDSFTFTDDHALFNGALFVMEKLPKDASPATADWRYQMILPDGSVFADSTGDNTETAKFCHTCHDMVAEFDYLFSVPEDYRLPSAFQ
jgi:hypothetical protein